MGAKLDLTGKIFGRLTVIEDSRERDGNESIKWKCQCECGNMVSVSGTSLTHGFTKSCGCLQKDVVSEVSRNSLKDLSGSRFGKLTVLKLVENIKGKPKKYLCKCDCGNEIITQAGNLRNGHTQSCGCFVIDKNSQQKRVNEYEVVDGYVRVKLNDKDYMLCDIDDWERLKKHCWSKGKNGYVVSGTRKERGFYFHKKVTNTTYEIVDHINRNKLDNRKSNLRITNQSVNGYNTKLSVKNTSGHKGVKRSANGERWIACITVKGRNIHLGTFDTMEEAINARKEAEEKYVKPLEKEAVYLC